MGAGAKNLSQVSEMSSHAAEVQARHSCIQAFEARCFAEFDATRLYGVGDTLNLGKRLDVPLVVVALVDVARVRPQQRPLERLEPRLVLNKAEQYRFKSCRARIVLLVRVGRRREDKVD